VIPPARWRGHLDKLLPARSKVRRVEHHAAQKIKEEPLEKAPPSYALYAFFFCRMPLDRGQNGYGRSALTNWSEKKEDPDSMRKQL
jgi:hypothetical protein